MSFALCSVSAFVACSPGDGMVPVTGKVTFDGAPPPGPGTIYFVTIESAAGFSGRPGYAEFDVDGVFEARSKTPGDGLLPGTYGVRLDVWEKAPVMGQPMPANLAPDKYRSAETSGIELVVEPGSRQIEFPIEIKTN